MPNRSAADSGSTGITEDRWDDPGGRTISSLKEFLSSTTGTPVEHLDIEFVDTVEQLRAAVFGKSASPEPA